MTAQFNINGKTFTGKIISRGFFNVDAPESYEVEINSYGMTKIVPITECAVT